MSDGRTTWDNRFSIGYILHIIYTYSFMYVQSTLPVQIGTVGSIYRELLYHFDCFVAASGTIGLEHREDMCGLEFSVCVAMGGEN